MSSRPSFKSKYERNCSLHDTIPLGGVVEHLEDNSIDINADKISVFDWNPLIDTIASDHSLRFIAVRSFYRFEGRNERFSHLQPAVFDRSLIHRLCSGLASCISKSRALHCFVLQGFPLEKRDIAILAQGLSENDSIKQLSLEGCTIGDSGVFKLVPILRDKIDLFWLNMTACGINEKGAVRLCDLVQSQSILRHSAAWADSLRYRQPSFGRMPGLRRLTLCGNPIGDRAALIFAERLKDDRWLRALDLQMCELTSTAALGFIEALQLNKSLVIVDLRKNELVDARLLTELKKMLNRNVKFGIRDPLQVAWRWLGDRSPQSVSTDFVEVKADAASKSNNRSVRAYTCCKSSCSARRRISRRAMSMHDRAIHVPDYGDNNGESSRDEASPVVNDSTVRVRCHSQSPNRLIDNSNVSPGGDQVSRLRSLLTHEIQARRRIEERLRALEMENSRLMSEMTSLRGSATPNASHIPDQALEQVEHTIAQFHNFLDYLKEKGMENLVHEGFASSQRVASADLRFADSANERYTASLRPEVVDSVDDQNNS